MRNRTRTAREEPSLWAMGGLSAWQLARRVGREAYKDDLLSKAAQLGYYFMLALFPALLFLLTLFGILADYGTQLREQLMGYLARVTPASAFDLMNRTLDEVSRGAGAGKLTFGVLFSLWTASLGLAAVIGTLNGAYGVEERRPFWKTRGIAILLTIALSILVMISLALVLLGGDIAQFVGDRVGLGGAFVTAWKILQWPLILVFMSLAFALVYYYGPDVDDQKWYFITPGSVIALTLWLLASGGFRIYLQYFDSYGATYGSLGAAIILMLWFYITGLAILMGGEVNSEIEHAAAEHGAADAKAEGEKRPAA